jgi:NAD(P)-dependent dehydrogenase (short-subunit alcohol dehydrogenase family)
VVISGRDPEQGAKAAKALGAGARFLPADLGNLDAVHELVAAAGHVDILVNNASAITRGPTPEQDVTAFDEVLAVNIRAPFFLTAGLVPKMVDKGSGSVVNVSSVAGRLGMPGLSVYGATKAAIESMTRTWAAEFSPRGVRVNAVAPGPTLSAKVLATVPEHVESIGEATALGRTASTDEIAEVVAFLAGDRASFVTGAVIPADGGRTAI